VELDYNKIAEKYNTYYEKMRKQCNVCHNAEICQQCIFNLGTIEEKNPVCNGFMTEEDYAKSLSTSLSYIEDKPGTYSKILKETLVE
jgi:uncharacterized protein